MTTPLYYQYWGKASKEDNSYHLLPYHCLDVAAVGKELLENNTLLLNSFSKLCRIEKRILQPIVIFFLVLHDLGKFSESFQNIKPELLEKFQGIKQSKKTYSKKQFGHDSIGFLLWKELIFTQLVNKLELTESDDWYDLLNWFMEASNGHHGFPPKQGNQSLMDYFNEQDIQAAEAFVDTCLELFKIEEFFTSTDLDLSYDELYKQLPKFSWFLTGFYVLCDWIGSGKKFKYCQNDKLSLLQYWEDIAIPLAKLALQEAGVLPCQANLALDPLKNLLDLPEGAELTPLQQLVSKIELTQTPQLFIIEDETGAGKTESSLILINRLMSKKLAQGFYLALPTMATADGIYPRIQKTYGKLYKEDQKPSLVLSHGAAKLSDKFTETILYPNSEVNQQQYTDDAQTRCQAWLADNRKKSLLAHVGVGTIDQAFLAILKVKYQSLRLIGLLGKILVIDEAHAYDSYMSKELEVLLEVHAAMGGTVIIMSATLPIIIKEKLANAFLHGIGDQNCQLTEHIAYPLLTHISPDFQKEIPCAINPKKQKKEINYQFIHDEQQIYELIKNSLEKNQCICWIRNSVKDARNSYKKLKKYNAELFHARFVLADRLIIQEQVLERFNKSSNQDQRQGRLLIATQVVEQSLDLDFDVMITDLAPIDLMLQRAGRLHRHTRDQYGNPKQQGQDERLPAMLTIHTPEITATPDLDWFTKKFPNARKVYSNHARLWAGLMELNKPEQKILPKNIKPLVESVYGENCMIPEGLAITDFDAEGCACAERSHAHFNTIDYAKGYTQEGQEWAEDLDMPTRLGEETITLTLAKWQEGRLQHFGDNSSHAWQKSEIRVYKNQVYELLPLTDEQQLAFETIKTKFPLQGKWVNLLPLTWNKEKELWQGTVINEKKQETRLFYSSQLGLLYDYEIEQDTSNEQLEQEGFI